MNGETACNKSFYRMLLKAIDFIREDRMIAAVGLRSVNDSLKKYGITVESPEYREDADYRKAFLNAYYDAARWEERAYEIDDEGRGSHTAEMVKMYLHEAMRLSDEDAFEAYRTGSLTNDSYKQLIEKYDLIE